MNLQNERLLFDIAKLFYEQGKSKSEIGRELGYSVTHIARLLDQAVTRGLVEIVFSPPQSTDYEKRLLTRYSGLKRAIVVPGHSLADFKDFPFIRKLCGQAAALYLDELIGDRNGRFRVAMGAGWAMYEMVKAMRRIPREQVEWYPAYLVGSAAEVRYIDSLAIITEAWQRSGNFEKHAFYSSTYPPEPFNGRPDEAVKRFQYDRNHALGRKSINSVYRDMLSADVVFCSLGQLGLGMPFLQYTSRAPIVAAANAGLNEEWLAQRGIVGDINYTFLDANGCTARDENGNILDLFISLGPEQLRPIAEQYPGKQVVVLGNMSNVSMLASIIKTDWVNVLITDETTAKSLLE